jgi:hypothetical protein
MRNISISDFIIWDSVKNSPVENLEEFKCIASLPIRWQLEISKAIEKTK